LMNCVFLGVLARFYLDDMTVETNILLLILLEQSTLKSN